MSKYNNTHKLRVAAYIRVSTTQDEQSGSYLAQFDAYRKMILSNPNWKFVSVFGDKGRSGTSINHRPGFNSMLASARARKIDLILTKSISRFSRNVLDILTITRELRKLDIEVYFEEQHLSTADPKYEIFLSIMASLAQEESRNLSENIRWGIVRKMEKGDFTLPYKRFLGYKKGKDGRPEIVKKEAKIIKHIYWLFLNDVPINRICRIMEKKHVKAPGGGTHWHYSTVRSILTNEKYAGLALLQKTYTPDYLTHKSIPNNFAIRQYLVENSHPAIIDMEDWKKVQEKLCSE